MIWRRIRQSRKRLLAQEADRATRWLGVVVVDAHRMGATVPESVDACVAVLRAWSDYMERWAHDFHND